jgi:rhamnulokinase
VRSAYLAVDLGASSGRVVAGEIREDRIKTRLVHRFSNQPVPLPDGLHWDVLGIFREILEGLALAGQEVRSLAVDAWGVDYGLLDEGGCLLGAPYHYRDRRTKGIDLPIDVRAMYRITGVPTLPINTSVQLFAAKATPAWDVAQTLLLIPDLFCYFLTGKVSAERTAASTTQLLDITTGDWAVGVIEDLGIPHRLFPSVCEPGEDLGPVLSDVAAVAGLGGEVRVKKVASHDTASAVVAVPATGDRFGYISCGTWSLVGLELDRPVLSEGARLARFTNEAGLDGTVRFLCNVTGLWLLQESERWWRRRGVLAGGDLERVLALAAGEPGLRSLVDPNHPDLLSPGDIPGRIDAICEETGQPRPGGPAATVRCIIDSLALAYSRTLDRAVELSGKEASVVHLVGGGAANQLLCQLTADACQRTVIIGPVEATAIGNLLVQARAEGKVGSLSAMRALVASSVELRTYRPAGPPGPWEAAARRLEG